MLILYCPGFALDPQGGVYLDLQIKSSDVVLFFSYPVNTLYIYYNFNFPSAKAAFSKMFPGLTQSLMEWLLTQKFDHELYSLKPSHRPMQQHPMVNDDLPNRLHTTIVGLITVYSKLTLCLVSKLENI